MDWARGECLKQATTVGERLCAHAWAPPTPVGMNMHSNGSVFAQCICHSERL
jgi:hypothetical protein